MRPRFPGLAAWLFAPLAVAASLPFSEGFESGNLSAWSANSPSSQSSLTILEGSKKEGQFGLRLDDRDATNGPQAQNHLGITIAGGTDPVFGALWVRRQSGSGSGYMRLVRLQSGGSGILLGLDVTNTGNAFRVAFDGASGFGTVDGTGTLVAGQWHLLEFSAVGLGTSSGASRIYLDGRLVATSGALDWTLSSWRPTGLDLGEPWSTGAGTAVVDFDDFHIDRAIFPSSLTFARTSGPAFSGDCVAFELRSHTSFAPSPIAVGRALTVALGSSGGGFFSDASCATPVTTLGFAAADSVKPVFFRAASPGVYDLTATSAPLLPAKLALSVDGPLARLEPATQTIAAGATATLDASGSRATDGGTLSGFAWKAVGGAAAVELKSEAVQSLPLDEPGRYVFELRVSDSTGRTSEPVRAEVVVEGDPDGPSGKLPGCSASGGAAGLSFFSAALLLLRRRRQSRTPARRP